MAQQKPYISTSFSYETLEETLDIKPQGAQLHIGIPKETAFQENRVALTPEAVSNINKYKKKNRLLKKRKMLGSNKPLP